MPPPLCLVPGAIQGLSGARWTAEQATHIRLNTGFRTQTLGMCNTGGAGGGGAGFLAAFGATVLGSPAPGSVPSVLLLGILQSKQWGFAPGRLRHCDVTFGATPAKAQRALALPAKCLCWGTR